MAIAVREGVNKNRHRTSATWSIPRRRSTLRPATGRSREHRGAGPQPAGADVRGLPGGSGPDGVLGRALYRDPVRARRRVLATLPPLSAEAGAGTRSASSRAPQSARRARHLATVTWRLLLLRHLGRHAPHRPGRMLSLAAHDLLLLEVGWRAREQAAM